MRCGAVLASLLLRLLPMLSVCLPRRSLLRLGRLRLRLVLKPHLLPHWNLPSLGHRMWPAHRGPILVLAHPAHQGLEVPLRNSSTATSNS